MNEIVAVKWRGSSCAGRGRKTRLSVGRFQLLLPPPPLLLFLPPTLDQVFRLYLRPDRLFPLRPFLPRPTPVLLSEMSKKRADEPDTRVKQEAAVGTDATRLPCFSPESVE